MHSSRNHRFSLAVALLVILSLILAASDVAFAQSATPASPTAAGTVTIDTAEGPVRGLVRDGYRLFRGIPYAAPPVGERRWQAPQAVTPWTGTLDATESGSPCPQNADPLYGGNAGNEDCLYLEVTVPDTATAETPKPVIVWMHGGGFIGAAGSFFDAHRLATQGDVVVVSINYRLGILGYFGYPGLEGSGNFGLQDQQASFEWVQRNIAAFGGDPGNVTIAGESAGAMSICAHLTAPGGEGLFHRAIIQSGPCTMSWPANGFFPGLPAGSLWRSPAEVEGLGVVVAEAATCADPATALDCLRTKTPAELLALPLAAAYGAPAWGGALLPASPADQLRAGAILPVPVISGSTRDEAAFFVATFFTADSFTNELYEQYLTEAFGDAASEVAARYADLAADSPARAWARISTDRTWACPTYQSSRLLAAAAPVFGFEFADPAPPPIGPGDAGFPLGAYHSSEIPYLFDYVGTDAASVLAPEQLALSTRVFSFLVNRGRLRQ
ncbi:MAG: carboxylesterase family protein [Chloroflexota bacterium]|nr:carboxylesterase family protein [Chloroflexota bacterium]